MNNILTRTNNKISSHIYLDFYHNYKDSTFLASTARSGSTWIAELINYNNEYRYMFEPFHSKKVPILKGFEYIQYLRPENKDQGFIKPAKKILSGRINNDWTDYYNKKSIYKGIILGVIAALISYYLVSRII